MTLRLEVAPAHGIRRISFGVGAEEAKQRRGARLLPLTCLSSGLTPAAEVALGSIVDVWTEAA
jgi:uncharacterized protein